MKFTSRLNMRFWPNWFRSELFDLKRLDRKLLDLKEQKNAIFHLLLGNTREYETVRVTTLKKMKSRQ